MSPSLNSSRIIASSFTLSHKGKDLKPYVCRILSCLILLNTETSVKRGSPVLLYLGGVPRRFVVIPGSGSSALSEDTRPLPNACIGFLGIPGCWFDQALHTRCPSRHQCCHPISVVPPLFKSLAEFRVDSLFVALVC